MELDLLSRNSEGILIEKLESESSVLLLKVFSLLFPLAFLTNESLFEAEDLVQFLKFVDDSFIVSITLKSFSQNETIFFD